MNTPQSKSMTVYRIVGDRRIPYILELRTEADATVTLVSEHPDIDRLRSEMSQQVTKIMETHKAATDAIVTSKLETAVNARAESQLATKALVAEAVASGKLVATTIPEILEDHPELAVSKIPTPAGVTTEEKQPDGSVRRIYHPTKLDIKVGSWVTPLVEENPIPGTDELRAEYFAAEKAIRDKHAADGTICKPCELGALIRKYRAKLESAGLLTE